MSPLEVNSPLTVEKRAFILFMKSTNKPTERELTRAELRSLLDESKKREDIARDIISEQRQKYDSFKEEYIALQESMRLKREECELIQSKLSIEQARYKAECEKRNKDILTISELRKALVTYSKFARQLSEDIEQNKISHKVHVGKIYSRNLWQRILNTKV